MTSTVLFDGTFEGFLTIVHNHYYEKIRPDFIEIEDYYQQRFDTKYYFTITDEKKAEKVSNAIVEKISQADAHLIYMAFLSSNPNKFYDMYKYLILGFKYGEEISKHTEINSVLNTINIARNVGREVGRVREFVRFSETSTGVFYSDISPDNNILMPVAEFFVDRFGSMNFVIHDVKRDIAAIFDTKCCYFREVPKDIEIILSKDEKNYQKLWSGYHRSAANQERANKKLQRLFLPMKYRKHMTEFKYHESENKFELI